MKQSQHQPMKVIEFYRSPKRILGLWRPWCWRVMQPDGKILAVSSEWFATKAGAKRNYVQDLPAVDRSAWPKHWWTE